MSRIRFRRVKGWQDKLRAYAIVIDGKSIGEIKDGSEVEVPVSPGIHTIQLRIDWCKSPELEVHVSEGGMEIVDCGPNGKPLLALLYISFFRGKYIWAKHAPSTT